jgi:hypothetical protein
MGPKGDKGELGIVAKIANTKIDEHFNLTILRADDSPNRVVGELKQMKIRRTDSPDIAYMEADPAQLWCNGIIEFRLDTRNRKFILTPIMRGGDEGTSVDITDVYEQFLRELL